MFVPIRSIKKKQYLKSDKENKQGETKKRKFSHDDVFSVHVDNENHNTIPDYIDLTEIEDPQIRNSVKTKIFHLVKELEAERYESVMEIINLKDADKVSTIEKILKKSEVEKLEIIKNEEKEKQSIIEIKEKEKQSIIEIKEKEKQSIIEIKDSDKLVTIERIMKTSEEEKLKIIKTQEAAQREVEQHKQSKLCMEDMCSVRGGLEFIRSKIFSNSNSSNFEEPVDKALLKLSDDKKFLKFLKKSCDDNFLRLDDVIKCMSGLYHTASKGFHGHKQITINAHEQTWSSNEIFSLGVLFEFFKIPWEYYDVDGRNYPYKISHVK